MPKPKHHSDSRHIIEALKQTPQGLKISEIAALLPQALAKRSLQRRLAELKNEKAITTQGSKSSTRYFLSNEKPLIQLSKTAQELKSKVSQPLTKRKPVAYHPDFLFSYQPNKTYYLDKKIRDHLYKIGQPFQQKLEPGTYAKRILHRLLIDLSWNSSRLEGNTYSLLETERLIEYGVNANGKDAFEAQMIINHKAALEFMVEHSSEKNLNKHIILNIHALLSDNLLANPRARGYLRQIPVGIGKTVYHPPEIPKLIEHCFETIIEKANKIKDPLEQSFFLMVQLPYLQPFEDVNKRVSRLSANIPLMKHNLTPLAFIDVPQNEYTAGLLAIYELNKIDLLRDVYIWAYERSAQHYQLLQNTLTEPNLISLRYKKELFDLVNFVITNNIHGAGIINVIEKYTTEKIDKPHRNNFTQLAEKEIVSIHAGNIAIYRISPEVFARWVKK